MSSIERRRRPEKFQGIWYPYVVRPIPDGWEVLLTGIERPRRVADFDTKEEAYEFGDVKNDLAYFERVAFYEAKIAIEGVMDRVRPEAKRRKKRELWRRVFSLGLRY